MMLSSTIPPYPADEPKADREGRVDYNEDAKPVLQSIPLRNQLPKQVAPILRSGPEYDSDAGPSSPAPRPERGDDGVLIFEGRWQGVFTPNVTPEEMFKGGAFAGGFFW
jgi:hypothetical protein